MIIPFKSLSGHSDECKYNIVFNSRFGKPTLSTEKYLSLLGYLHVLLSLPAICLLWLSTVSHEAGSLQSTLNNHVLEVAAHDLYCMCRHWFC